MDRLTKKLGQDMAHKLAARKDPELIAVAHRTAGEMADVTAKLFPGVHAFDLLHRPLPRRQVLCAFMSFLEEDKIQEPEPLRNFIDNCSNEELVFIRFHGYALETQWALLTIFEALKPSPLPRQHYDVLATIIEAKFISPKSFGFAPGKGSDGYGLRVFLGKCVEHLDDRQPS